MATEDDEWRLERIVLKPLNPEFAPLVLMAGEEGQVRAVEEFVRVVE